MHHDPALYILAASVLSAAIGFFAACLIASGTVRRANIEGYKEAVRHYQAEARRRRAEANGRA